MLLTTNNAMDVFVHERQNNNSDAVLRATLNPVADWNQVQILQFLRRFNAARVGERHFVRVKIWEIYVETLSLSSRRKWALRLEVTG